MEKFFMLKRILACLIAVPLLLATAMPVLANTDSAPTSDGGVKPYILENPGPGGNITCQQLNYPYSSARSNYNEGSFDADFPTGIDVSVTNGTYVGWDSTYPIGAVIVKGSAAANIYEYDPQSKSDAGLAAPVNSSGEPAGLSNLTFCWDVQPLVVTKTAIPSYDLDWDWTITKTVNDEESIDLGILTDPMSVSYKVTINPTSAPTNIKVSGEVTVENPAGNPTATGIILSDILENYGAVNLECGDVDITTLAAGDKYTCTYEVDLLNMLSTKNTIKVTTDGTVPGNSDGVDFNWDNALNEEYNECVDVDDDKEGYLGKVCASDPDKYFEYDISFSNEAGNEVNVVWACGDTEYINTATYTSTENSEVTGSDSATVFASVECFCSLSQGYWFAKPGVAWPFALEVGGHSYSRNDGLAIWKSLNKKGVSDAKKGFLQVAAIKLSGGTAINTPTALWNDVLIIEAFLETLNTKLTAQNVSLYNYKPAGQAAGRIGDWIDANHCTEEVLFSSLN
jgi:hypothetical protein